MTNVKLLILEGFPFTYWFVLGDANGLVRIQSIKFQNLIREGEGNMDNPIVSISCISYNHGMFIKKALDSFLEQKTNFPFEILLHDDASTDGTADMIRAYAVRYPEIVKPVYQTENQHSKGINVSKVYNYPRAKGKYIAICEGDDYWTDPDKLQLQFDYMENHPQCSFCFHNAKVCYMNGVYRQNFLPMDDFKPLHFRREDADYNPGELILLGFIPTASIFARKEYMLDMPDFCPNPVCGDLPLRLILSTYGPAHYFDRFMSMYRTANPNSISGQMQKSVVKMEETTTGHERILRGFDQCTDYKWHEQIEYDVMRRWLRHYIKIGQRDKVRKPEFCKIYRELTAKTKLKYFISSYLPWVFKTLKKFRNMLIGLKMTAESKIGINET